MSTKLVIFDLDGTLLDTSEGIKASVKYVIEKYNLPLPTETILNSFIGPPIQASFKHLYNLSDEKSTALAALFREQYKSADLFKAKPYDNVFEVLRYLRSNGVKTAVATYKREDYTKLLLDHFGLSKYFDIICGSDFEGKLQKKDIILNAVNKSRFSINDTIMVGDTILDAEGASIIGMDFIAALYGFGFKNIEETSEIQCLYAIDDIIQITEIIKNMKEGI